MADAAETITEIIRPFGDGKNAFRLAYAAVSDWEKRRDRSLFAVYNRMLRNNIVFLDDVREILHMALVAAGMKPEAATTLVKTWVELRPLGETYPLALEVMDAFFFGNAEYLARDEAAQAERVKFLAQTSQEE
nr:GTA-gp10 family protein [uncultured Shinella sp.]